uniref:Uncharacterized protein n=1 Tax=Anguilla anguilla TaxID=7936 RepID=A0A0E9VL43_ANGAN
MFPRCSTVETTFWMPILSSSVKTHDIHGLHGLIIHLIVLAVLEAGHVQPPGTGSC